MRGKNSSMRYYEGGTNLNPIKLNFINFIKTIEKACI